MEMVPANHKFEVNRSVSQSAFSGVFHSLYIGNKVLLFHALFLLNQKRDFKKKNILNDHIYFTILPSVNPTSVQHKEKVVHKNKVVARIIWTTDKIFVSDYIRDIYI